MSMRPCYCYDLLEWVIRRGSIKLSVLVNISLIFAWGFDLIRAASTTSCLSVTLRVFCVFFFLSVSLAVPATLYFVLHLLSFHHLIPSHPISFLPSHSWSLLYDPVAFLFAACWDLLLGDPLQTWYCYLTSARALLTDTSCRSWQPTVTTVCLPVCRSEQDRKASSICPCIDWKTGKQLYFLTHIQAWCKDFFSRIWIEMWKDWRMVIYNACSHTII